MSANERPHEAHEFDRFLFLLLEQGIILSILIDEYARATGIAFAMLKNKIYYLLSNLKPLHEELFRYLSSDLAQSLMSRFDALFDLLNEPKKLIAAHTLYTAELEALTGDSV